MTIPSANIVTLEQKIVDITLSFSHPFEVIGMALEKYATFR